MASAHCGQPADPMLCAWEFQRREAIAGKEERSDAGDEADRTLARDAATSIAGVIAKLRSSLWAAHATQLDAIATSDIPLEQFSAFYQEKVLGMDYPTECIWTAITSLERMMAGTEVAA